MSGVIQRVRDTYDPRDVTITWGDITLVGAVQRMSVGGVTVGTPKADVARRHGSITLTLISGKEVV